MALAGSAWGFGLGLGITQLLAGIGSAVTGAPDSAAVAAAGVTTDAAIIESVSTGVVIFCWAGVVALIGFFAWLGYAARRPSFGLFLTGFILYALDTAVFIIAGDWIGLLLHGVALFFLFNGLMKIRALNQL